jgi:CheY-like chemotaxis protein
MEFDRSHRQILCALLEELGTTVEVAESPAVAFEFLNAGGFDLILIDVGLPMPQVLDSARRIRELPEPTSDIPVIGFTAHLVEFSLDECLEAGMDDLLLGPARKHHVHAALATWLPGAFGGQSRVSRILPRLG